MILQPQIDSAGLVEVSIFSTISLDFQIFYSGAYFFFWKSHGLLCIFRLQWEMHLKMFHR